MGAGSSTSNMCEANAMLVDEAPPAAPSPPSPTVSSSSPRPEEECWICLSAEPDENHDAPCSSCHCPRVSHRSCLARWCLQQVGQKEERACRFCAHELPHWGDALMPQAPPEVAAQTTAMIAVCFDGIVHKIPVRPGVEGEAMFKAAVKSLFGFAWDTDFEVTFEVRLPGGPHKRKLPATSPDSMLVLRGLGQFEAAATCAQASAVARRLAAGGEGSSRSMETTS